jgi:hypothetical protein
MRRAEKRVGAGAHALDGGQSEVGEHDPAVLRQQHVVRLDVTVQYAGCVRGAQRRQDAQPDPRRVSMAERTGVADGFVQRAGRHVLHDDPRSVRPPDHVVDLHDAGVVQPGRRPRLTHRVQLQLDHLRRGDLVRRVDLLSGHDAVQQFVLGSPDPAHAADADHLEEAVAAADQLVCHTGRSEPAWLRMGSVTTSRDVWPR